jgi:hypothetical protein
MSILKASRVRIKSENYGLPRKKKFPLNTKRRAVSAVAYSIKGARQGTITPKERDIVLRKVKEKYPDINISFKSRRQ